MHALRLNVAFLLVMAVVLQAVLLLVLSDPASAQPAVLSAELKRVVGRVEVLRKGQTQWVPAVVGDRLVEGDDIRSFPGAQVEVGLPDTSSVVLAENSRLLLTKLEFDLRARAGYSSFTSRQARWALPSRRPPSHWRASGNPTSPSRLRPLSRRRGVRYVGVHRRRRHHDRGGAGIWLERRDLGGAWRI